MSGLAKLVGDSLLGKDGAVKTESVKNKVVGLYFSAHWCPPCRGFTPALAEWYKQLKAKGVDLEIVFVSSDRDEASFNEYYGEMPWLAMPYEQRELKDKLSSKLKVRGIPTLAFADAETGEVYTTNGREVVASDPEGEDFPWRPPTIEQALGTTFVRNDGTEVSIESLKDKYLAIYFSAHWCPPCRNFTVPVLKPVYEKVTGDGKDWEVIFVSSDKSQGEFDEYFKEQPWLAVPFSDRKRKDVLSTLFEVEGIPTLIQLDKDRKVLNKALRGSVSADQEGADFPWAPKPVTTLEEGAGDINDVPALIAIMDEETDITQAQFEAIFADIAAEHKPAVADGSAEDVLFLMAKSSSPVLDQVRKLCSLKPEEGTRTLCNGDMCLKLKNSTALVLLDIPDRGGFYKLDGELTKENIMAFFKTFTTSKADLERKQLG